MRNWRVLSEFDGEGLVTLTCPECGLAALCPIKIDGPKIISTVGLRLVLDPPDAEVPDDFMPEEIQCKDCRTIFTSEENGCVRQDV